MPALGALGVALGSCSAGSLYPDTCDDPCGDGEPGTACANPCSDVERLGWGDPTLLWVGEKMDVPECPPHASQIVYEGHGDLDDSNECGCACGPATCALPSELIGSDMTACLNDVPGATVTPIYAPANWDGSCVPQTTAPDAVVRTVAFRSPSFRPCEPVLTPVLSQGLGSPWRSFARACSPAEPLTACTDTTELCAPTSEPLPKGFLQCILSLREEEDVGCPADYPRKHVFYQDLEDTRSCGPCECEPPTGGLCSAYVRVHHDQGCTTELHGTSLSAGAAACYIHDWPGTLVGGMSARFLLSVPGSCAPKGGVPMGKATPTGRSIFCCQDAATE